jgi:hypothetical protein
VCIRNYTNRSFCHSERTQRVEECERQTANGERLFFQRTANSKLSRSSFGRLRHSFGDGAQSKTANSDIVALSRDFYIADVDKRVRHLIGELLYSKTYSFGRHFGYI